MSPNLVLVGKRKGAAQWRSVMIDSVKTLAWPIQV